MLAKVLIIESDQNIQSYAYNDSSELVFHIDEDIIHSLEAIYKVRINSLNQKSKLAYIEYAPNLHGIVNLKKSNLQAGSNLLCQLTWPGNEKKLPKFSTDIKLLGKYVILLPNDSRHYFSKHLKTSLSVLSEKYKNVGIIFRSSIDDISDHSLIENEIQYLLIQVQVLKSWQESSAGQLTAPTYRFMQLLRAARLSNNVQIHTNSVRIYKYLMPYLDLWQIDAITLDESLVVDDISLKLDKCYAEFSLEIHKLSGINLIDINSKNSLLNFYQVNYLAIDEIVHQIWLRDLSGIILLDFIKNMSIVQQQKLIVKLEKCFEDDWRQNQILGFTKAGICEIIRNK